MVNLEIHYFIEIVRDILRSFLRLRVLNRTADALAAKRKNHQENLGSRKIAHGQNVHIHNFDQKEKILRYDTKLDI